jgi:hypothetical protein
MEDLPLIWLNGFALLALLPPPGLEECHKICNLLRFQRGAKSRHVHPTVDDADGHVVFRQCVGDVG